MTNVEAWNPYPVIDKEVPLIVLRSDIHLALHNHPDKSITSVKSKDFPWDTVTTCLLSLPGTKDTVRLQYASQGPLQQPHKTELVFTELDADAKEKTTTTITWGRTKPNGIFPSRPTIQARQVTEQLPGEAVLSTKKIKPVGQIENIMNHILTRVQSSASEQSAATDAQLFAGLSRAPKELERLIKRRKHHDERSQVDEDLGERVRIYFVEIQPGESLQLELVSAPQALRPLMSDPKHPQEVRLYWQRQTPHHDSTIIWRYPTLQLLRKDAVPTVSMQQDALMIEDERAIMKEIGYIRNLLKPEFRPLKEDQAPAYA